MDKLRWFCKVSVVALCFGLLGACLVPADEMRQSGIMGSIWKTAGKKLELVPATYGPKEAQLFNATVAGSLNDVLTALDEGASLRAINPEGDDLLTVAVFYSHSELVALFLEHELVANAEHFCQATTIERMGCLNQLLTHKAQLNFICSRGDTPLTRAVRFGDPDLVEKILGMNADPNMMDAQSRRPIDYAQEQENLGGYPDWALNYDRITRMLRAKTR